MLALLVNLEGINLLEVNLTVIQLLPVWNVLFKQILVLKAIKLAVMFSQMQKHKKWIIFAKMMKITHGIVLNNLTD